jgi:hypothetical protein
MEWALGNLPITTQSSDGQFTKRLYEIAEEKGRNLRIGLGCGTFPQALQALASGPFAAILPRLAIASLDPKHYVEIPSPDLDTETRHVVLAWNPRLMHIRGGAEKLALRLRQLMRF